MALALHAAELLAFWAGAVQQSPVVVKCPAPAPEPVLKWLLQTTVPVIGGTLIAVLSSIYNRRLEEKKWLRDQKSAEWSQLIRSVANIERVLRMGGIDNHERIEFIVRDLKPAIHELVQAQANCIFLKGFFENQENHRKFFSFLQKADGISSEVSGWRDLVISPLEGSKKLQEEESSKHIVKIRELCNEITGEYFEFQTWLRDEAEKDLKS